MVWHLRAYIGQMHKMQHLIFVIESCIFGFAMQATTIYNLPASSLIVAHKKLISSTVAMGNPHSTLSKSHDDHEHFDSWHHLPAVLTAHNKHSQGLSNGTGVDCVKSHKLWHWQCKLQQLDHPTKNPYQDFTAPRNCRIVILHNNNNAWHHHQTLSSLSTVKENKNSSQQTSSSNAAEFSNDMEELDTIIARCQWLQQWWPMPIVSIDPNGTIQDNAQQLTSPPATSSPRSSVTLASEDAIDHILTNSQHLLDNMQQQSQTLSNLVAMSDKLVALMTHVTNVVNNLFSTQSPKIALVPSPNPMVMTKSTIISTPAPVPKIIKLPSSEREIL